MQFSKNAYLGTKEFRNDRNRDVIDCTTLVSLDTVEIGQELGKIITSEPAFAEQFETAAKESAARETVEAAMSAANREPLRVARAPTTATKK